MIIWVVLLAVGLVALALQELRAVATAVANRMGWSGSLQRVGKEGSSRAVQKEKTALPLRPSPWLILLFPLLLLGALLPWIYLLVMGHLYSWLETP